MDTTLKLELLEVAKDASIRAGEVQLKYYGKKKEISHKSNEFDLVTNADKEAEEVIISLLKERFPDHGILAEESASQDVDTEFKWIIDPIDGTVNYAHNFPQFCVSIGLMYRNELVLGVVYDALKREMFHGIKNMGAFLNDEPIHVTPTKNLARCLMATGFPADVGTSNVNNINLFIEFCSKAQAVRRPGSAALDLCYVAAGRLDGFWELKLSPWDTAAGAVIVREAGGMVTNFFTGEFDIFKKHILATNGQIHDQVMDIIKEVDPGIADRVDALALSR